MKKKMTIIKVSILNLHIVESLGIDIRLRSDDGCFKVVAAGRAGRRRRSGTRRAGARGTWARGTWECRRICCAHAKGKDLQDILQNTAINDLVLTVCKRFVYHFFPSTFISSPNNGISKRLELKIFNHHQVSIY